MVQHLIWMMGQALEGQEDIDGNQFFAKCFAMGFEFGGAFERKQTTISKERCPTPPLQS